MNSLRSIYGHGNFPESGPLSKPEIYALSARPMQWRIRQSLEKNSQSFTSLACRPSLIKVMAW